MNSNKVIGKLVRGVIYDNIDLQQLKNDIFEGLHCEGIHEINNYIANRMYEETDHNLSIEDAKLYLNNMGAIASLTGYNDETGKTSNLIIPKRSLSNDLVRDLERVDLGKNLLNEYADSFFVDYIGLERNVTPEEISEDLDGELIDAIKNGKRVVFVADKDMTVSEFKENFTNFIKELENAIKTA